VQAHELEKAIPVVSKLTWRTILFASVFYKLPYFCHTF